MLRRAALVLASVLICGCQGPGQPYGSAGPFGNSRLPPPGTNSYPKPDVYFPPGSNPAGAVGATAPVSTAPGSLNPNSLFNNKPQNTVSPAAGSSWPPDGASSGVRLGESRTPAASTSIRLNGMPVNDATRPPAARTAASASGIPEITDLPRGNLYGAQPAGYFAPAYPPYATPYGSAAVPGYAPGSIGNAASNSGSSGNLGWRSKSPAQ